MDNPDNRSALNNGSRLILLTIIAIFMALQGIVLFGAGGILDRHGFWGGFPAFNTIMMSDPVATAGLIDLTALIIFCAVVVINGVPRGQRLWLVAGLIVLPIYPGLTALGFLLLFWKRFGQFRP